MSEQRLLFDLAKPVWIDRLWQTIEATRRREIVSILAQMARDTLAAGATTLDGGRSDES